MNLLLRKLEAYGFKSFADKTEIEFGKGITAIVGPNGSGKSNISDAIRWVLGEQSVRTLRGTKMEDVIFAGSSGRRPLGVAEVSLIFDNTDGSLAIDYNEVIITRRVFRSGESEYYINKSACRLKDIHELLADTGLGRDAMTVIGQNKVDEVLNSKPEDRRNFLEEAAGITKYKNRKKDALRRLDDANQNLTRVSDIINELDGQLGPLEESSRRTRQYNELYGELKACQVTVLLHRLEKAAKMVESATLQQTQLAEDDIAFSTALLQKENQRDVMVGALSENERATTALSEAISQADTELERLQGKVAVLQERINHGSKTEERLSNEASGLKRQQSELEKKRQDAQSVIREKRLQLESMRFQAADRQQRCDALSSESQELEHRLENDKNKTLDYLQELVGEKNRHANLEKEIFRLAQRQQELGQEENSIKEQQRVETEQLGQLERQQTEMQRQAESLIERQQDIASRRGQLTEQEFVLRQDEKKCAGRLQERISKQRVLVSMEQEYEGFSRGIRGVLKSNAAWRSGICGAVAQLLDVPERYLTAMEIAMGGALQNLVVESDEIAKGAIRFLKEQNLGRATFLPLNTIRPLKPKENEIQAAKRSGSLGLAAQLVKCDDKYRSVVEFLLGRTIVAETINDALRIAKEFGFSLRIVTLDGELVQPGGALSGGSLGRKDAGLLSRGPEIKRLDAEIQQEKEQLDAIQTQLTKLATASEALALESESCRQEKQGLDVKLAEITVHQSKLTGELRRIEQALTNVANDVAGFITERERLTENRQNAALRIKELEQRDSQHQQAMEDWKSSLSKLQSKREQVQNELTEHKVRIGAGEQELTSLQLGLQQLQAQQDALQERYLALGSERDAQRDETAAAQAALRSAATEIEEGKLQRQEKEEERRKIQGERLELLAQSQQLEKELKDTRRRQQDIQNRLHECQLIHTKYGYEINVCHEQLEQQFGLTEETARPLVREEDSKVLLARSHQLESEIAQLGPINPAAIDEYARVRERYEFLSQQSQDLLTAQEYLLGVIREIDGTMATRFAKAFEEINRHFGEIFAQLFGGGQAALKMVEPGNVLETGVEIIVQPPGKKLQNLVLLSGGERALTVIALLFALLTHRPAPFVVVDEIDAALDEANVDRLSGFLRNYGSDTQFIVVTHRKGTMEAADIIHGITIEESGVSRLVSVKLMDKAAV
ncbi:chromosome segregation protein SMC [Azotosporobacter soli]|uniref:chromosome segregation protein SMC n=1 Tax=Azotosporobacter soli TaxID=3055040 RepID=UPI0031FEDED4